MKITVSIDIYHDTLAPTTVKAIADELDKSAPDFLLDAIKKVLPTTYADELEFFSVKKSVSTNEQVMD